VRSAIRTLLALCCALAPAAGAGAATAAEPTQPATPAQIVAYHDSGEWDRTISSQLVTAENYVRWWLTTHRGHFGPRPAIVLDIDDTSVSLYDCGKARNFVTVNICAVNTDLPAIAPVLRFARAAQARGVAVFFVTGRPEGLRALTLQGLAFAGYKGPWTLYMRPNDYHDPSLVPFKSGVRAMLTASGYRILVNVGDQQSDLAGGYSQFSVKLPNPMYFTP
jgi:hypothetical protein